MKPYRVLDLFSGIGGFSLGLERVRWPDGSPAFETVAFCEIDEFPQRVLAKHWPDVPIYEDVQELTRDRLEQDGIFPNVITGGWPCQDFSVAGRQAGIEGERSGLWAEIVRLCRELQPQFGIFENVPALLSGADCAAIQRNVADGSGEPVIDSWMGTVLRDMAALGRRTEWHCIPAAAVNAPHQRDRVFIITDVADADEQGLERRHGRDLQERPDQQPSGAGSGSGNDRGPAEPGFRLLADGLSRGLAGCRAWEERAPDTVTTEKRRKPKLMALGNALVPQIPEIIGQALITGMSTHPAQSPTETAEGNLR